MRKGLYPAPQPIKINPLAFIFWIFIFAFVFFVIGMWTVHYPSIAGVI
ncbi:MAG: hypothetical protein IKF11_06900 [Methanobrevibacter sp.]|nr:hypothetical protein [Methanobrevibacter sp.]